MIVLGIDPGLATLGWGVIEADCGRQRLIAYGCILTTPSQTLPERLIEQMTPLSAMATTISRSGRLTGLPSPASRSPPAPCAPAPRRR